MNSSSKNGSFCWCDFSGEKYSTSYEIFNFVIVMLAVPMISIFGFTSNMINAYLYTRPVSLTESTSIYLAALAASDAITDFSAIIVTLDSAKAYSYTLRRNLSPFLVKFLPLTQLSTTCSIYFTVGAAVDCFVKVCWKSKSACWNNLRRSRQFVLVVILTSGAFNIPRFFELMSVTCFHETSKETRSEVCPTDFRMSYFSHQVYNVYLHMVMMIFLPFLILAALNTMIVLRLQRRKKLQRLVSIFSSSFKMVVHRNMSVSNVDTQSFVPENDDNTATLIMVVVLFLVCNSFGLATNVADSWFEVEPQILNYLADLTNVFTIINASANFLIYVTYDKKYRQSFRRHFLCNRFSSGKGFVNPLENLIGKPPSSDCANGAPRPIRISPCTGPNNEESARSEETLSKRNSSVFEEYIVPCQDASLKSCCSEKEVWVRQESRKEKRGSLIWHFRRSESPNVPALSPIMDSWVMCTSV